MAKKADLIKQAQEPGLEVSEKNTIVEIEAIIAGTNNKGEPELIFEDEVVIVENSEETESSEAKTAKAGKRSAKAIKEAEEQAAKEERKELIAKGELDPSEEGVKKGPAPKTRTLAERRSRSYKKAAELVDKSKVYSPTEACELIAKTSYAKFDASVDLHVNLNVDPKQADQNIRGVLQLPNGSGKTIRVAVFAPEDQHEAAKKAGADIVGEDTFLQLLDKEQFDFDVLIASPKLMAKLGKYARSLGPKGLMPNPKSGTVTDKIAEAVKDAKGGKVEFRVDKQSIVHQSIGKVSFTPKQLVENLEALMNAIKDAKPASVKGLYILKANLASTMGPSIQIEV